MAEWDASGDSLWRPLLGRTVTVGYLDAGWQVIEVRSGEAVVYCCSFQCDRVVVQRDPQVRA